MQVVVVVVVVVVCRLHPADVRQSECGREDVVKKQRSTSPQLPGHV